MYLEAFGASLSAASLGRGREVLAVAEAAHSAPPAHRPRPVDHLLNGLTSRFRDGYQGSVVSLRVALRSFGRDGGSAESRRWHWLVCRIAADLWEDEMAAATVLSFYDEALVEAFPVWGGAAAHTLVDVGGHEATIGGQGRSIFASEYSTAVRLNGRGQYEAALPAAQRACEDEYLGVYGGALSELVEAATRMLQQPVAADALARLRERTQATATEWGLGIEARARALVDDGPAAESLYKEAIERLGSTRIEVELARSQLLYGEWLRRENRRIDARAQLHAALDLFDALDVRAFAERAQRELLATGETARKRSVDTNRELTAQEELIAQLAGQRLTNLEIATQLFISPRTVEWHLRKVFTKLDISSRRQLRVAHSALVPKAIGA
jgi:DNA-binding CsgD family transcriptional regulator